MVLLLPPESKAREGEAYLLATPSKFKEKLNVYLINESDFNLTYKSFSGLTSFEIEAKNKNGVWEPLERFRTSKWFCGTGLRLTTIPSEHYTYRTFHNSTLSDGAFETELRYIFESGNSMIVSNTVPVSIDYGKFQTQYVHLDEVEFENSPSNPDRSKGIEYKRNFYILNKIKYGYYDEIIEQISFWIEKEPYNYELKYVLAYSMLLKSNKDIPKTDKYFLAKKAVQELAKIPETNKRYAKAQEYIIIYENYLFDLE